MPLIIHAGGSMDKKTENRGGARPGAGRKKNGAVYVTTAIAGPPEEIQRLKDNAAAAGQSVSRFVLDRLAQLPKA